MIHPVPLAAFLADTSAPLLDVRAPVEFAQGHIPGARSLPLFSDDERARIGTTYKQVSPEKAVLLGLDFFGPKLRTLVEQARKLAPGQEVRLHCWRGGMRSGAVAWLLNLAGLDVQLLQGGYKEYRRWAGQIFADEAATAPLRVLGGFTGAGKTDVLHELARRGEAVVDLEGLAHHKGSAFGAIGQPTQPTQEQFENELAWALHRTAQAYPGQSIWVEDESRSVGAVSLPPLFYERLRAAPLTVLDVPRDARVAKLADEYGREDPQKLALAVMRIGKKLGGLATKQALGAIVEGDFVTMVERVLDYYDKAYGYGLEGRAGQTMRVATDTVNAALNAKLINHKLPE